MCLILVVSGYNLQAQVSSYSFSSSFGAYSEISGGTVLGTATGSTSPANLNSAVYPVILPFAFNFNGQNYTSLNVSTNGYLTFGATAPSTTLSAPISSTTAYDGAVSVFGRDISAIFDIAGQTGEIRWETVGTAPNREVVIQWKNFRPTNVTSTASVYAFSFQIRLSETSNAVSAVYDSGSYLVGNDSYSSTAQIGLRGFTNADFNNRLNPTTVKFMDAVAGTARTSTQAFSTVNIPPGMPDAGFTTVWIPPTCFAPSGITVGSATTTSASVTWNAVVPTPGNGYDIYYNTTGTAPNSSTVLDATNSATSGTNSATLTGLSAGTTYFVWVRSKCSPTDISAWSEDELFNTVCVPINAPYTENFDTTSVGSSSNNNAPNCWSYLETSGFTGYGYVRTTNSNSAPNGYYLYNSSATTGSQMLVSPQTLNLSDGTKWVKFSARSGANNYLVEVGTLSDPGNPASFTTIGSAIPLTTSHVQYTVVIPAGSAQHIAFRHGLGGTYRAVYLDDITVETAPTCFEPTALTVTPASITTNGGSLTWTAPSTSAGSYEVYYSTDSTAPTAATVLTGVNSVTVNGTAATINGLTPAITYYVWVRSVCSPTERSIWTPSSVTLRTLCQPPALLTSNGETVCSGGSATLTATADSGATINWYANSTDATALATGTSFTTPPLTSTTTYYAAASTGSTNYVGPVNPNSLTGGATTGAINTYYIQFEVTNIPVNLMSVDVFPEAAGQNTTLEILQGPTSFTVINTIPFTSTIASDGTIAQTVPINIMLNPGLYRMRMAGGDYYRNYQSNADFPYSTANFSITTGSNVSTDSYYFMYNLQVGGLCESARTPVLATVDSSCTMGTSEADNAKATVIYPNPFTDVLNISEIKGVKSISILDISGRVVKSIDRPSAQINLSELQSGMYLISLQYKDGSVHTMKAIKK
ncbi:MAG: fibronectin type III domain-containing protein [Kaistella sp.]|nr:fibronectin type III domain-containing protein [Kaistella sp.]